MVMSSFSLAVEALEKNGPPRTVRMDLPSHFAPDPDLVQAAAQKNEDQPHARLALR